HNDGCFIAVFNVSAFRSVDTFKQEVTEFAEYLKATKKQTGVKEIYYPGEVEYLKERDRAKNGIEVDDKTWAQFKELGAEYGIADKIVACFTPRRVRRRRMPLGRPGSGAHAHLIDNPTLSSRRLSPGTIHQQALEPAE